MPAHCLVTGQLQPVDTSSTAQPIRFAVALPAMWNRRAIQLGGGGMNGTVPRVAGADLRQGYVSYGSDSGHANDPKWALNDEAIRNLGYAQMKKTHDTVFVLIERAYGERPAFNYYVGGSQGGREGLTVAQRYPDDYDGVLATVPIVGFSTLMLAPTLSRVQERPLSAWVPPTKGRALLAEFMRQCDGLDARIDGVINNYIDCRALFNVNDGGREPDPWTRLRCPNDVDPNPDASEGACLTAQQIETVNFVFSQYTAGLRLANGRTTFGMWAPTTAVAGGAFGPPSAAGPRGAAPPPGAPPPARGPPAGMTMAPPGGLFVTQRYRGQEGAATDAPVFSTLGSNGVNGFVMQDLDANPLDYDTAKYRARREQTSQWLDSTDPDLAAFRRRGGKLIVIVGTDDTIAPSGEQLDYYQSMLDAMGRRAARQFRAPLRVAADGARSDRQLRFDRRQRRSGAAYRDSQQHRPVRVAARVGRGRQSARQERDRHRLGGQPADVLVPRVSALRGGRRRCRRLLCLRGSVVAPAVTHRRSRRAAKAPS